MKTSASTEVMGDLVAQSLAEDFLLAADDFAVMQQEHRAALLAGNSKEIFSWRQGREQAFRNLARILERVVAGGKDDKGCVVRAREIMRKLLVEEEVLQELVMVCQVQVQEQLLGIRKGKEVLHGYNINKGLVPRPRYLSSRM